MKLVGLRWLGDGGHTRRQKARCPRSAVKASRLMGSRVVCRAWLDDVLAQLDLVMIHQFLSVPAATPI